MKNHHSPIYKLLLILEVDWTVYRHWDWKCPLTNQNLTAVKTKTSSMVTQEMGWGSSQVPVFGVDAEGCHQVLDELNAGMVELGNVGKNLTPAVVAAAVANFVVEPAAVAAVVAVGFAAVNYRLQVQNQSSLAAVHQWAHASDGLQHA